MNFALVPGEFIALRKCFLFYNVILTLYGVCVCVCVCVCGWVGGASKFMYEILHYINLVLITRGPYLPRGVSIGATEGHIRVYPKVSGLSR